MTINAGVSGLKVFIELANRSGDGAIVFFNNLQCESGGLYDFICDIVSNENCQTFDNITQAYIGIAKALDTMSNIHAVFGIFPELVDAVILEISAYRI